MITHYSNCRVIRNHQINQEDFWVANGKIIDPQPHADKHIDVEGCLIAPGYIDLQLNGGFGHDFTSEPESVDIVAKLLPKYGVTAFLPTLISSSGEQYRKATSLLCAHSIESAASILGIHLEGPFLSPDKPGAHDPQLFRTFKEETDLDQFYGDLNQVKMITAAPELPGAIEAIRFLKRKGIVVSAGHTNASYEKMNQAIEAGITFATHLFNAMPPIHHRQPGVVGAVLTHPNLFFSVIADETHLHPSILKLLWQIAPQRLVIVSDAMEALGLPDGLYHLGPQDVDVKNSKACLAGSHTIAGSMLGIDSAVRHLKQATDCSIVEAIEAASYCPAQVLGIEKRKGTLDIGADADFLFLNDSLNVIACFIAGSCAWQLSPNNKNNY